jgi:hypothetical protein
VCAFVGCVLVFIYFAATPLLLVLFEEIVFSGQNNEILFEFLWRKYLI